MAVITDDPHFRQFANSLESAIANYRKKDSKKFLVDFFLQQKKQVETLIALERDFRHALIGHSEGVKIYREFVDYICNKRKNILDARPYFRERQNVFTQQISDALRRKSERALFRFNFNYRFIQFVLSRRVWKPKSRISKLAREITKVRNELIVTNMPLAISRARIFYGRTPKAHLAYMDFIQIACEGLMSGIDKFVPPFSRAFRAVAIGRMTGNFIDQFSMDQDTILQPCGKTPKKIKDFVPGDLIQAVDNYGNIVETNVIALHDHGTLEGFEVVFDDGYSIVCSENHKFLTKEGMVRICDIVSRHLEILCEPACQNKWVDSSLRSSGKDQAGNAGTRTGVLAVQGDRSQEATLCGSEGKGEEHSSGRMDVSLRDLVREETGSLWAPGVVSVVQERSENPSARKHDQVASRESGGGCKEHDPSKCGLWSATKGQSGIESQALCQNEGIGREMARGASRGVRGQYQKSLVRQEAIKDGGLVAFEQHADLGGCANSLRREKEASRLRIPRSQDLGGGGRQLSLFRDVQDRATSIPNSGEGCNVGRGMSSSRRRDIDQIGHELFCQRGEAQEGVDRMAYSHAPLASTGNLVLRKVVQYRSVGFQRMYDLEVAHPKHNFLLPNGVVTSNSETLIHFYPVDKRKIYRANKLAGKNAGVLDFDHVSEHVNQGVEISHQTTPSEIANLMAAASTVSTDTPVTVNDEEESHVSDRFAAPASTQPDVCVENGQVDKLMADSMGVLSSFECKVSRLKGVHFCLKCKCWLGLCPCAEEENKARRANPRPS